MQNNMDDVWTGSLECDDVTIVEWEEFLVRQPGSGCLVLLQSKFLLFPLLRRGDDAKNDKPQSKLKTL